MANDRVEILVLKNLIHNEKYARRVLPYLKDYHFDHVPEKEIFLAIQSFMASYNNIPTKEAVLIEIEGKSGVKEEIYARIVKTMKKLVIEDDDNTDYKWLASRTERFCQDKEIAHALSRSIEILEDPKMKNGRGEITHLLTEALGLSFDPNVGHDYLVDYEEAFDHYNRQEEKVSFDIDILNKITLGGIEKGTLNMILAGTGVGKTMVMCHLASSYLSQGLNVLYITLEMSRFEIRRRIDANLFDVGMNQVKKLQKEEFAGYINGLRKKTNGKLIIKQYPTASASVLHFKHLVDELRMKKKFVPDVILIDYLNICLSSRLKASSNAGSYAYMQSISQEFRGFAGECNCPIWSGTQLNREGMKKKQGEVELWDTSESIGVPFTTDFMFALMATPHTDRFLGKILKNRYDDIHLITKFWLGVDRAKMRIHDVDEETDFDMEKEADDMEEYEVDSRSHRNGNGNGNGHHKKGLVVTGKKLKDTLKKFNGRGAYNA